MVSHGRTVGVRRRAFVAIGGWLLGRSAGERLPAGWDERKGCAGDAAETWSRLAVAPAGRPGGPGGSAAKRERRGRSPPAPLHTHQLSHRPGGPAEEQADPEPDQD